MWMINCSELSECKRNCSCFDIKAVLNLLNLITIWSSYALSAGSLNMGVDCILTIAALIEYWRFSFLAVMLYSEEPPQVIKYS